MPDAIKSITLQEENRLYESLTLRGAFATSHFGAKLPLAQRELLVEVPYLRVMSLSQITVKLFLGSDSRQRSEFRDFRVLGGQQRPLLSKLQLHHET